MTDSTAYQNMKPLIPQDQILSQDALRGTHLRQHSNGKRDTLGLTWKAPPIHAPALFLAKGAKLSGSEQSCENLRGPVKGQVPALLVVSMDTRRKDRIVMKNN